MGMIKLCTKLVCYYPLPYVVSYLDRTIVIFLNIFTLRPKLYFLRDAQATGLQYLGVKMELKGSGWRKEN